MDDATEASAPLPRERRSIHLFDLDDTLIHTDARVLVRDRAGSLIRALSTAEFTGYAAGPDEVLDFTEFSDLGILSRGIVVRYTRYGTRSEFGILTARADKKLHAPFLIRLFRSLFGVRLANEYIFAVSDARFSGYKDRAADSGLPFSKLSVSQRKALVIAEDLVGRGFNDISFYDDSFKVMRQAYPHVTYRPHFIDPTWKARLQEFLNTGKERKPLIKGATSVKILLEHHTRWGLDHEPAMLNLLEGKPIRLDTLPVEIAYEDGKFVLRRAGGAAA
jgi:hypothetical protein